MYRHYLVLLTLLVLCTKAYSQLNVNLNPGSDNDLSILIKSKNLILINLDLSDIAISDVANREKVIGFKQKSAKWSFYYSISDFIIKNQPAEFSVDFYSEEINPEDSVFLAVKSYDRNENLIFEKNIRVKFYKGKWSDNSLKFSVPSNSNKVFFGILSKEKSNFFQVSNIKLLINDSPFTGGSNLVLSNSSIEEKDKIAELSQVWGLIKYFYPFETLNPKDWDMAFIQELANIQNDSTWDINQTISQWRSEYLPVSDFELNDSLLLADNSIKDLSLNNENLLFIKRLQVRKRITESTMFSIHTNVLNPIFNEEAYDFMDYSDDGLKILGLARFINIIKYFYPYIDSIHDDHSIIFKRFFDLLTDADSRLNYELTILKLLKELNDNHALIRNGDKEIDNYWGIKKIPIGLAKLDESWVVTNAPDELHLMGLKKGDSIIAFNGIPLETLEENIKQYVPTPNKWTTERNIARLMVRTNQDEVSVNSSSGSFIINTVSIDSANRPQNSKDSYKILEDNIGYMNLKEVDTKDINVILDALKESNSIIMDIRGYPKASVANTLAGHFISESKAFARVKSINPINSTIHYLELNPVAPYYNKRIYILINEETQSSAEFVAMALAKSDNVKIIGSNSAGSIGNITEFFMPSGILVSMSGIAIDKPDGTPIQIAGIVPDIMVSDKLETEKDELITTAIELERN